jgi:hypothetical protein
MVLTQTKEIPRSSSPGKKKAPAIIKWKGKPMLRSQSINAAINDIYESSRTMDFLKINLIGQSGTGKTTLSYVLSHSLHVLDPSFTVHHLQDRDLINFKETIERLPNGNLLIVFDDLSGLVSNFGKTALEKLRADLTTARHLGDTGRKLIIILNFHSQKQLDKVLRISNFTFYTECMNEEVGYFEELLGKQHKPKILQFVKLRAQARMYHKFSFTLSKGNSFNYIDGEPFRLLLYNNGISTRFVVSPQLEFITEGKICQICFPAKETKINTENLEKFYEDYSKQFGKGVAKRAVELKLLQLGISVQPKRVLQAGLFIERFLAAKQINLKELADKFGLKERSSKLFPDKQPSKEILA